VRTERNASLKPYNTFGLDVKAERLYHLESEMDLVEYLDDPQGFAKHTLLIGGGSNMLLAGNLKGSVARVAWTGRRVVEEGDGYVVVEAAAGENWHAFVQWTVDQGWGGLQNLSLIPGLVGAAPVQNIGAYGVETKDSLHSLRWMRWEDGEVEEFSNADCGFGYRESVFKGALRDQGVILSVQFKLTTRDHVLLTHYGSVAEELAAAGVQPSLRSIADAVIAIRQSKLPNPAELGNSGSFFKNPSVEAGLAAALAEKHPSLPQYPQPDGRVKLAAGWLIEHTGWKGKRVGNAGMHAKQALVLVNYGGATASELVGGAQQVQHDVRAAFGVDLEMEVNLIGQGPSA
jgi:UDP-N-acetylmuramate dehydrogenase